jgi:hypothetical protein
LEGFATEQHLHDKGWNASGDPIVPANLVFGIPIYLYSDLVRDALGQQAAIGAQIKQCQRRRRWRI